ncbi:exported protein of unknown function [Legionella micdadei]|uniref:Uncharacterized protein n=1 Tax=Legionella micdadei TaxID=451 RepID=A0A098GFL1_LEGMI|nr:exported protein of unknown function [Legionella micdadei]
MKKNYSKNSKFLKVGLSFLIYLMLIHPNPGFSWVGKKLKLQ